MRWGRSTERCACQEQRCNAPPGVPPPPPPCSYPGLSAKSGVGVAEAFCRIAADLAGVPLSAADMAGPVGSQLRASAAQPPPLLPPLVRSAVSANDSMHVAAGPTAVAAASSGGGHQAGTSGSPPSPATQTPAPGAPVASSSQPAVLPHSGCKGCCQPYPGCLHALLPNRWPPLWWLPWWRLRAQ